MTQRGERETTGAVKEATSLSQYPKQLSTKSFAITQSWIGEVFKLHRVAKSSLCAETQVAADAADALEFVKTFWSMLDKPDISPLDISLRTKHPSALVVDAKALYDAIHKEAPLQGAANKRTGIELLVLRQTLANTCSIVRWVSSERQIADGLTQISARQLFADRLRV